MTHSTSQILFHTLITFELFFCFSRDEFIETTYKFRILEKFYMTKITHAHIDVAMSIVVRG